MECIDVKHLAIGSLLAVLAVFSLIFEWSDWASWFVIVSLSIYCVFLLIECAHRSRMSNDEVWQFELPNREWALVLVALFVVTNVFSFANIYLQTCSVEFEVDDIMVPMKKKVDAIYFSAVTVSTLGYGEFTPRNNGRVIVLFHLASGLLLLFVVIPVAAARISNW